MQTIKTINPYTQEPLKTYDVLSDNELIEKIEKADVGFQNWRQTSLESRTEHLRQLAELLLDRKKEYAKLMAEEMGKPIAQGIAEIEKCAWVCDFYAKNASDFLADQLIETDANESFISYDPLGVILAIMPWNYPFWQVLRFAAPTLMAGNTVLLKHAANTTQCGLEIEKLLNDAGFPEGCFQTLLVSHEQIEQVIANDAIKAVSLTGSEKAGKTIAQLAGKYLKKSVLELGGNNACIILKDANLDRFIETMAWARMQNAGQSCIAAKRFIVEESIHDEFVKRFMSILKDYPSGNPLNESTKIGPMARIDLADQVENQVLSSLKGGAEILLGNKRDKAYYEPTLVGGVAPGMPLFDQEVFGPVAAVIKAKNKQKAYSLAQMSKFGLGCMVFTEDIKEARHRIGSVPDGAFFVNEMVKSDPRLPFGGTKSSGYGRELSKEGIMEFVNKKTVFIRT
ncbi:NAD-dependent succinate-semialdehyde dehydrogenase [Winogradskyella aurantia]|uniref:Succinate-semialdehyde dehydrogenase n=1 Tax=Winogradskyella aurantia TaxID=1915063 RepID=A0A265UUR5_9FLAO|nr:NAD-dependent succinate-semialdehyde dehydrogenase [Winogradskyella aurantia]OZV69061.1 succinate-semialdehyde dehydrogenase [Winogradskyella aurantia]